MKHLKTYEDISYFNFANATELKQYFVIKYIAPGNTTPTAFNIYKLKEVFQDIKYLRATQIYKYTTIDGKLNKTNEELHFFSITDINKKLVYQSDNLQDCLDIYETIIAAKKYNI